MEFGVNGAVPVILIDLAVTSITACGLLGLKGLEILWRRPFIPERGFSLCPVDACFTGHLHVAGKKKADTVGARESVGGYLFEGERIPPSVSSTESSFAICAKDIVFRATDMTQLERGTMRFEFRQFVADVFIARYLPCTRKPLIVGVYCRLGLGQWMAIGGIVGVIGGGASSCPTTSFGFTIGSRRDLVSLPGVLVGACRDSGRMCRL